MQLKRHLFINTQVQECCCGSEAIFFSLPAPEAPHPHNITDVEVSQTAVDIYLWPVEQKYGPVR